MKGFLTLFFSFFIFASASSQEYEVRNFDLFSDFLTEQESKLESVDVGMSQSELVETMGDTIFVKVPKMKRMKPLNKKFFQPYFVNEYKNNSGAEVLIYWYFSMPKHENGIVSKRECTPVLMEEDRVVGKGWDFFNAYRRSKGLRL